MFIGNMSPIINKKLIFLLIFLSAVFTQSQNLYIEQSIGTLKLDEYSDYNSRLSYRTSIGIDIRDIIKIYSRIGYWYLDEINNKYIDHPYRIKVKFISPGFGIKAQILSYNQKTGLYIGANGIYYFVGENISHTSGEIIGDYAGKKYGYSYELGIFHKILPKLQASLGLELLSQSAPLSDDTKDGESIINSWDYSSHPISFSLDGININFAISYNIFNKRKT